VRRRKPLAVTATIKLKWKRIPTRITITITKALTALVEVSVHFVSRLVFLATKRIDTNRISKSALKD
jgi:hypothetical protein